MTSLERTDRLAGLLLGTAVGDALGLPREMLRPDLALARFGAPPLHHALVCGRGMISDDAEHACLTAQALLAAPDDPAAFARRLAAGLRGWFALLPAGIGKATLRACLRLWRGVGPEHSGVCSAGNGPAMRSPLLGACAGGDTPWLRDVARRCTRLTHTDPAAEDGALLVALAAARAVVSVATDLDPVALWTELTTAATTEALRSRLELLAPLLAAGEPASAAAAALGLQRGVSGYIAHTVPIALYGWLAQPGNFRGAVESVILLGGDTDTVAAITGALCGGLVGVGAIPDEWLEGLLERPRSVVWMREVAARLAATFPLDGAGARPGPAPLAWPLLLVRNPVFTAVVLAHGLRRLLPSRRPRSGRVAEASRP